MEARKARGGGCYPEGLEPRFHSKLVFSTGKMWNPQTPEGVRGELGTLYGTNSPLGGLSQAPDAAAYQQPQVPRLGL